MLGKRQRQKGQTMVEYIIILALVGVATIAAVYSYKDELANWMREGGEQQEKRHENTSLANQIPNVPSVGAGISADRMPIPSPTGDSAATQPKFWRLNHFTRQGDDYRSWPGDDQYKPAR